MVSDAGPQLTYWKSPPSICERNGTPSQTSPSPRTRRCTWAIRSRPSAKRSGSDVTDARAMICSSSALGSTAGVPSGFSPAACKLIRPKMTSAVSVPWMTSMSCPESVVATYPLGTVMPTWYVPGARPSKANAPLSSVVAERDNPLAKLMLTSTWARPVSASPGWPLASVSTNAWPWTTPVPTAAGVDVALTVDEAEGLATGEAAWLGPPDG